MTQKIEIVTRNDAFLVCRKPAGILSQSSTEGRTSMVSLLEAQLQCSVYPVHRLDLETSGLMVYACSSAAAAQLSGQIQNGTFHKEYLAVVQGTPEQESGTFEDLLLHDQRKNKSYVVQRKRKGVREAKLAYTCLAQSDDLSLVQIRLFTGRTHQIRVQFGSRGNPLIGDRRYGGEKGSFFLASVRLSFRNPLTGCNCSFEDVPVLPYPFQWEQKLKTI